MKKALFLSMLSLLNNVSFAQEILIFDAEKTLTPISINETEAANLKKRLEPLARKKWAKDSECEPDFSLIDVKNGAFTQAATEQKAYIYQYCELNRGSFNQGIAITEQGKLIANILFFGSSVSALKKLSDINQNGLDELLLTGGFTGQGTTVTWISLLEIGKRVHDFGFTQVSEYNEGSLREEISNYSSKIYVETGENPRFFEDKTEEALKLDEKNDKYNSVNIKTKKHQALKLEKDEAEYELTTFTQ